MIGIFISDIFMQSEQKVSIVYGSDQKDHFIYLRNTTIKEVKIWAIEIKMDYLVCFWISIIK